jgi:hypothetical protein
MFAMQSSTLFLATLLGLVVGVLLGGSLGGLLGAAGSFLLLRLQQLSARLKVLEDAASSPSEASTQTHD